MVRDLTDGLAQFGITSVVAVLSDVGQANVPLLPSVSVRPCGFSIQPKLGFTSTWKALSILLAEARKADIVHLHELWHSLQLDGAIVSRILPKRYIISPHGELHSWCLRQHRQLKAIAWRVYEQRIMQRAAVIHALTHEEAASIRKMGVSTPIRTIPSGLNLRVIDAYLAETRKGVASSERARPYIAYVGRLSEKKQIGVLIEALANLVRRGRTISLVLAGPDPGGRWKGLLQQARRLGVETRVRYAGFVDERTKYSILAGAEVFVLPSKTEGLSMSALEALACGTPVVVSPESEVPYLAQADAGRVVAATPEHFGEAIDSLLHGDPFRAEMRARARKLVQERFTSRETGRMMKDLYEHVLAG